jgi:hypothetical protein
MTVLSCNECRARHSEYLDGLMDAATAEQWRAHLSGCAVCGRYDRVLRRGLAVLAAQQDAQLTSDFSTELQRRIAFEDRRLALRPMTSLATTSVVLAAVLAFAAWVPVLMLSRDEQPVGLTPIASASTRSSEIAWHAENAVDHHLPTHIHQARRSTWLPRHTPPVIEPAYTPVVLESPIAPLNYARTVSFGAE